MAIPGSKGPILPSRAICPMTSTLPPIPLRGSTGPLIVVPSARLGEPVEEIAVPITGGITARERRTFIVAGLVVALTQLGFFITSAALPLYLRDLGAAEGRIGLEVGAGNLAAVFVTFALGPALNRFGPRPFITLGAA